MADDITAGTQRDVDAAVFRHASSGRCYDMDIADDWCYRLVDVGGQTRLARGRMAADSLSGMALFCLVIKHSHLDDELNNKAKSPAKCGAFKLADSFYNSVCITCKAAFSLATGKHSCTR